MKGVRKLPVYIHMAPGCGAEAAAAEGQNKELKQHQAAP